MSARLGLHHSLCCRGWVCIHLAIWESAFLESVPARLLPPCTPPTRMQVSDLQSLLRQPTGAHPHPRGTTGAGGRGGLPGGRGTPVALGGGALFPPYAPHHGRAAAPAPDHGPLPGVRSADLLRCAPCGGS